MPSAPLLLLTLIPVIVHDVSARLCLQLAGDPPTGESLNASLNLTSSAGALLLRVEPLLLFHHEVAPSAAGLWCQAAEAVSAAQQRAWLDARMAPWPHVVLVVITLPKMAAIMLTGSHIDFICKCTGRYVAKLLTERLGTGGVIHEQRVRASSACYFPQRKEKVGGLLSTCELFDGRAATTINDNTHMSSDLLPFSCPDAAPSTQEQCACGSIENLDQGDEDVWRTVLLCRHLCFITVPAPRQVVCSQGTFNGGVIQPQQTTFLKPSG